MDAFQGSYKTEPYDLRCFSAYYLLLRFLLLFSMEYFASVFYVPVMSYVMIVGTVIFAAFQPYKNNTHNRIDIISMLLLALFYVGYTTDYVASYLDLHWILAAQIMFVGSVIAMTLYLIALLLFNRIKTIVLKVVKCCTHSEVQGSMEVFDRNGDDTPLLQSASLRKYI